jgi:UDP-4-amino-4,6-dideoxy-L-N-acetyl-beta-L-altrosamine transaminase
MQFNSKNKISYGKQYIDSLDIKIVSESLKEELITTGNYVKKFEAEIKTISHSKFAYTCINATAGLHLAFLSINLKKNDIVIMPSINFISAFRMASLLGAKIYLADVDPLSGQMTPETLKKCIKKNNLKKIKLILTMFLGGYPENAKKFFEFKKKYKCFLIEDACHAFGAKYNINGQFIPVGSCKHSDICVFSFHPVKPITTGEGGAITTNNRKIANKIILLRNHGIVKSKKYWNYDINKLGFNYRLSDLNCSLGFSQIKKLSLFIKKRKKIFFLYKNKFLKYSKYIKIFDSSKNLNSYHLILISIDFDQLKYKKNHMLNYLNKINIFPQFHYKPIYRFSFYKKFNKNSFSGSEFFYKNSFSLPVYHSLMKQEQFKVIENILKYIFKYKK